MDKNLWNIVAWEKEVENITDVKRFLIELEIELIDCHYRQYFQVFVLEGSKLYEEPNQFSTCMFNLFYVSFRVANRNYSY